MFWHAPSPLMTRHIARPVLTAPWRSLKADLLPQSRLVRARRRRAAYGARGALCVIQIHEQWPLTFLLACDSNSRGLDSTGAGDVWGTCISPLSRTSRSRAPAIDPSWRRGEAAAASARAMLRRSRRGPRRRRAGATPGVLATRGSRRVTRFFASRHATDLRPTIRFCCRAAALTLTGMSRRRTRRSQPGPAAQDS